MIAKKLLPTDHVSKASTAFLPEISGFLVTITPKTSTRKVRSTKWKINSFCGTYENGAKCPLKPVMSNLQYTDYIFKFFFTHLGPHKRVCLRTV